MKEFKLLNISSINKYGRALFLYKYVNSQLPSNFDNYFINNHEFHNYDTRFREDMHIPNSRLNIRKQTIRNAGPELWNSIFINYLNDAWNNIYYLLMCSHIKGPCSTSLNFTIADIPVAVQKNRFHRMLHMEEIFTFYAVLTFLAAVGLHMCKGKSFSHGW